MADDAWPEEEPAAAPVEEPAVVDAPAEAPPTEEEAPAESAPADTETPQAEVQRPGIWWDGERYVSSSDC